MSLTSQSGGTLGTGPERDAEPVEGTDRAPLPDRVRLLPTALLSSHALAAGSRPPDLRPHDAEPGGAGATSVHSLC